MISSHGILSSLRLTVFFASALVAGPALLAQDSGGGMELHANGRATASDVGLPAYPGASLYREKDNDGAVDMGFTFGDVHFRLVAASYLTADSASRVLDFYRKPLARYGEVLECDHGKPIGALKATRSGLTCSSDEGNHMQMNGESSGNDHDLRAGTPERFRIVGISDPVGKSVRFGLVYVEVPKDSKKSN